MPEWVADLPGRYIAASQATQGELADIPGLVKLAWDIALLFPECGDEIIADLMADIGAIASREDQRVCASEARARTAVATVERVRAHAEQRMRAHGRAMARDFALAREGAVDLSKGIDPRGFHVYLLWGGGSERPVYVGQSTNLLARLGNHMGDRVKRGMIQRVTVVRCKDRAEMDRLEDRLIGYYQPELNIQGCRG